MHVSAVFLLLSALLECFAHHEHRAYFVRLFAIAGKQLKTMQHTGHLFASAGPVILAVHTLCMPDTLQRTRKQYRVIWM